MPTRLISASDWRPRFVELFSPIFLSRSVSFAFCHLAIQAADRFSAKPSACTHREGKSINTQIFDSFTSRASTSRAATERRKQKEKGRSSQELTRSPARVELIARPGHQAGASFGQDYGLAGEWRVLFVNAHEKSSWTDLTKSVAPSHNVKSSSREPLE